MPPTKSWVTPKRIAIGAAVVAGIALAPRLVVWAGVGLLSLAWGYRGPDGLVEVQRTFDEHRPAFEELDSLVREGYPCARTDGEAAASERCDRYLNLLAVVGAEQSRVVGEPDGSRAVSLSLGGEGNYDQSYYIRAVKLGSEPDSVVADVFEHLEREGVGGSYSVYSPLGGDWYVELEMAW